MSGDQEVEHTWMCRNCGKRIVFSRRQGCYVHQDRRVHCRDRRNRPALTFAQLTTWRVAK
jgi:hypothetical protein